MVGKVTTIQKMSASRLPNIMGFSPGPRQTMSSTSQSAHAKKVCITMRSRSARLQTGAMTWRIRSSLAPQKGSGCQICAWSTTKPYMYKDILQASLDGGAKAQRLVVNTDPDANIYVMNAEGTITLDGPGVLEAKLTRAAPSDTPAPYRGPIQLQGQMLCTGAQWGVIATLYQGVELYLYVYKADAEMQQKIVMACSDFERRVRDEDWYPAMSAAEAADMKGDAPEDVQMDADDDLQEKIERLAHLRTELKAYEALVTDLQLDIMNAMGEANICNAGRYKSDLACASSEGKAGTNQRDPSS